MAGQNIGLKVLIDGETDKLQQSLKDGEKSVELFGHTVTAKGALSVAGLAGAAGLAAKGIADMTTAAAEDRDEFNKLAAVYEAVGIPMDAYIASTDAAIEAGAAKAFSDSEVRDGLQSLIAVTGDADKANELLSVSMDVARLAGVDLSKASDAVAKAAAGQDTALRRMIPALAGASKETDIVAEASRLAAGQADLYAESSAGMGKQASDAWAEIAESIGEIFLPILDAVLPALLPILKAFGELVNAILPILIPLINKLAKALSIVANALATVVGWVTKLIDKIGQLISRVRDLLPDLGRLGNIGGGVFGMSAATFSPNTLGVAPFSASPTVGSAGPIIFNITGDPATIEREVLRALRTWARRNGILIQGIGA